MWITSSESMSWARPRPVRVVDVRPGPEGGAGYARLEVTRDPDLDPGAALLLARSDPGPQWRAPEPGRTVRVLVWWVDDPDAVWQGEQVVPPTPRPTSYAELAATREDAERVARSAGASW